MNESSEMEKQQNESGLSKAEQLCRNIIIILLLLAVSMMQVDLPDAAPEQAYLLLRVPASLHS